MTIAYYHGAPGSYKTYSMVKDWLMPAILSNRPVLTNIRGVKQTDNITVVASSKIVDAMFLVKPGTLILLDELGQCFDGIDFKKYVAPQSNVVLEDNDEKELIKTLTVFADKHRHFNLDIIGTAPSYKRVPDGFKSIAEYGYKHKNLESLGFKGWYLQGEHSGEDTGKSEGDITKRRMMRVKKQVFDYYQSTGTGEHKGSAVKSPLYKHPAVLFLFAVCLFVLYFIMSHESKTIGVITGEQSIDATKSNPANSPPVAPQLPPPRNELERMAREKGMGAAKVVDQKKLEIDAKIASALFVNEVDIAVRGLYSDGSKKYYIVGNCQKTALVDVSRGRSGDFRVIDGRLYFLTKPLPVATIADGCPVDPAPVPANDSNVVTQLAGAVVPSQ